MDPNANLQEQLRIARFIQDRADQAVHDDDSALAVSAARLAELVLALDEWQRKGGFSPYAGQRGVGAV